MKENFLVSRMKKLYIKDRVRRKEEFQFFMHDFIDACKEAGVRPRKDILPSYRWYFRAVIRNILLWFYRLIHHNFPWLFQRKEALIVTANGVTLLDSVFPYYGIYEIVPILWDVWPSTWERMYKSLKLLDVRTIFVTSHQVADMINKETSIHAYWIPEGIRISLYQKGDALLSRQYDLFEMGRRMQRYHEVIEYLRLAEKIKIVAPSNLNANGTLDDSHVAYTNQELYALMSETKIMVCFPQCDTNPDRAGDIETLTLRYWEAMLSGCLMIGRAPKELIELIGYNPVVEIDWERPEQQLCEILSCIDKYQKMVNHNYEMAKIHASWDRRILQVIQILKREYEV